VRLTHAPDTHAAVHHTLQQWRLAQLPPGEVAARAIFHAALAASPVDGYTYAALASPCSRPWWVFHVDLNVHDNDCFSGQTGASRW